MTNVTEHDSKKKWECNCGIESWINLLIRRYSIRVDYLLEDVCELVCFKVGRWTELFELDFFNFDLKLSGRVGC
jgi:hypothetical protein